MSDDVLTKVMIDRRLDREDFQLQLDGVRDAVERHHWATARAMLRGAMLMVNLMEKRSG
jgi:hypothetical protein